MFIEHLQEDYKLSNTSQVALTVGLLLGRKVGGSGDVVVHGK
jgi:hypothetical protein